MKLHHYLALIAILLIPSLSCKKNTVTTQSAGIHLVSNTQVGLHIVDKDGRSLYFFSNDADGLSNCSGGCSTIWPAFLSDSMGTTFGDGLSASDFGTITLGSGSKQTTYKGWPLYYYAPGGTPEAAGETGGEGVNGIWFVAKTNYTVMVANYQLAGADGTHYLADYTAGDGRTLYLCDGTGHTLYTFVKDSAFINKFTKPDFSNNNLFPIDETDSITVAGTLDKSLFKIINFNGKNQLTYNGWPLYYYGADNQVRGSTKGISFPPTQPVGAIWPVAIKAESQAPR